MSQNSLKVLNHSFFEGLRERKADVWTSLGRQFKLFLTSISTEDLQFYDDTMKKMKSELKLLRTWTSEKKFGSGRIYEYGSKNPRGEGTQRSFQQGRCYNNNSNNWNSDNRSNNNSQWSNKKKNIQEVSISNVDLKGTRSPKVTTSFFANPILIWRNKKTHQKIQLCLRNFLRTCMLSSRWVCY